MITCMDFTHYFLFIILSVSFVTFLCRRRTVPITNWPVLGMTPDLILNAHRVHDFVTHLLKLSGDTFMFRGPWFANMDMLVTSDPANIHHMLSKNFPNYPKGPNFRNMFDVLGDGIFNSDYDLWEIHRKTTMALLKHPNFRNMFDVLGDGIFNSDYDLWEIHRKTTMALLKHPNFNTLLETIIWNKVEKGLLPFLNFVSDQQPSQETDLQEVFQRFTFDVISMLVLDYDPESLSLHLPYIPCEKAFTEAEEALLWRHVLPEKVWKLQRRVGIGKEKKLSEACKALDEFIYSCLSRKEDELSTIGLLTSLMTGFKGQSGTSGDPRKFLKDTILSLMIAGRATTSTTLSWFFYLLAQNPNVENKIREEIKMQLCGKKLRHLGAKELGELVYLHGALCEALRLFPPVALEHQAPSEPDFLPSGHHVDQHTKIILSFYSMGRTESIWGEDCMEFKPERWFSQRGKGIKHELSYKFTAFLLKLNSNKS